MFAKIDAYPDADFAGMYSHEDHTDPACAQSSFAECPVFWQSKLQTETALSTMEAEIIALAACCRELFPIIDMVHSMAEATNLPIGNNHECLHTRRQFGSTCVGSDIATTVYSTKQVLRD